MPLARHTSVPSLARKVATTTAWVLALAISSHAGQPSAPPDCVELVRRAVQNEIKAGEGDFAHFMFHGIKTTPRESTTRIYAETKEAIAGMVVAYNGKPLTPEQREAEQARIEQLANHPDELRKKREQEKQNEEHTMRIMRALPDAFLYEYVGDEQPSPGIGGASDRLVKLRFRPNPTYQPPSRVEEVLTGMQGYVLIDPVHLRIAGIDGTLFKEVGFGWGILGHLNRGGRFIVQQQDVGDNVWEISSMTLNFTGKILVFKNLTINSKEVFSDFKPIPPNLTFAQGVDLLKKEQSSETADNCCRPSIAQEAK